MKQLASFVYTARKTTSQIALFTLVIFEQLVACMGSVYISSYEMIILPLHVIRVISVSFYQFSESF